MCSVCVGGEQWKIELSCDDVVCGVEDGVDNGITAHSECKVHNSWYSMHGAQSTPP